MSDELKNLLATAIPGVVGVILGVDIAAMKFEKGKDEVFEFV